MVAMAITTLGAMAAAAFAWLKDRDKLKYDARQAVQEEKIKTLTTQVEELQRLERECRAENKQLRKEVDELQWRVGGKSRQRRRPNKPDGAGPENRGENT